MFYFWQGVAGKVALAEALRVALEALAFLSAPSDAASIRNSAGLKVRLQGCVASLVALTTIWEVGQAAYLPELSGFAETDLTSIEKVGILCMST